MWLGIPARPAGVCAPANVEHPASPSAASIESATPRHAPSVTGHARVGFGAAPTAHYRHLRFGVHAAGLSWLAEDSSAWGSTVSSRQPARISPNRSRLRVAVSRSVLSASITSTSRSTR